MIRGGNSQRRAEIGLERRERTRRKLLSAAAQVLALQGEHGVSIEGVVSAASVARGTFYNYWQSREDLLKDLWDHVGHDPFQAIQATHASIEDAAERLSISARLTIRRAAADHAWGWLVIAVASSDLVKHHELLSFPMPDILLGIEQRRFTLDDPECARDLIVGSTSNAMRMVMTIDRGAEYAESVTELMLRALGLPHVDAYRTARMPLPDSSGILDRPES